MFGHHFKQSFPWRDINRTLNRPINYFTFLSVISLVSLLTYSCLYNGLTEFYWIWHSTEFTSFTLNFQYSPCYVIFSKQSGHYTATHFHCRHIQIYMATHFDCWDIQICTATRFHCRHIHVCIATCFQCWHIQICTVTRFHCWDIQICIATHFHCWHSRLYCYSLSLSTYSHLYYCHTDIFTRPVTHIRWYSHIFTYIHCRYFLLTTTLFHCWPHLYCHPKIVNIFFFFFFFYLMLGQKTKYFLFPLTQPTRWNDLLWIISVP